MNALPLAKTATGSHQQPTLVLFSHLPDCKGKVIVITENTNRLQPYRPQAKVLARTTRTFLSNFSHSPFSIDLIITLYTTTTTTTCHQLPQFLILFPLLSVCSSTFLQLFSRPPPPPLYRNLFDFTTLFFIYLSSFFFITFFITFISFTFLLGITFIYNHHHHSFLPTPFPSHLFFPSPHHPQLSLSLSSQ